MSETRIGSTTPKLVKIAITDEADQKLEAMLRRINDGNRLGRIGKRDLASWIIHELEAQLDERTIERVRLAHLDAIAFLTHARMDLEAAASSGASQDELRALSSSRLAELVQLERRSKRLADPTPAKAI